MGSGESGKGWMQSGMRFGVGDEVAPGERGPLLPLRVLIVADLVPRGAHNAGASPPEGAIRVELAEFDDLFKKLRPRVAIDVPSVLAEGKPARVDLAPTSLKSFRPDGLCFEVPLLRSLLDGRIVLERLRDGSMSADAATSELERLWSGSRFAREVMGLLPSTKAQDVALPPLPTASAESAADALLDMVDLGPSYAAQSSGAGGGGGARPAYAPKTEQSKFSALIAQVAMSGSKGATKNPGEAIARVEKAIAAQLGAILQHPEVRRLEESWRGVRFLVERAKGHAGVRVEVVCARPDDMADALARAIRTNASSEPPVSFAVVDLEIDGTAVGLARLEKLAGVAEDATAPVLVNASPALLGVESLRDVERLDNKAGLFQAPERVPWRSTAAKGPLRWVTLAANRMLARPPFDKQTSRVREANVKELPDDEGAWVWLEPAWGVASLALASFR
ncbi:MAG TPA: type VI secretion system contractile sheath large subunit, partial [Minicystis sp.]|nr:type VI secretion system contractile sheath large subunit [Minicystis sp.]